ncbi:hypothetical protein GE09DRAFT_1194569 [Coniochaeta sp. 2T2.1]|nr:hypothetical protein GE09DRAFT_1194569 [Coniochaeta sp. 2T2.1]
MPLEEVYPDIPDNEGCVLQVTIYVAPDQLPKFFEAYRKVYDACVSEEECTFFSVYEDPEEPGKLSWVEHWTKNPKWLFAVQFKKKEYAEYFKITEPMFVKPREFRWLRQVEGYTTLRKGAKGVTEL